MCSLAWATDGSFLAIGNDQGDVELWDADTGQRVRKMSGHQVSRRACEPMGLLLTDDLPGTRGITLVERKRHLVRVSRWIHPSS